MHGGPERLAKIVAEWVRGSDYVSYFLEVSASRPSPS
jgi:hypothetical protein